MDYPQENRATHSSELVPRRDISYRYQPTAGRGTYRARNRSGERDNRYHHSQNARQQFDYNNSVDRTEVDFPSQRSSPSPTPTTDLQYTNRSSELVHYQQSSPAAVHWNYSGCTPSLEHTEEGNGSLEGAPNDDCSSDDDDDVKKPAAITRMPPVHGAYTVSSKKTSSNKTIEVSPGEYFRLRGADETWRAIHCDFYMPSECLSCTLTVLCIQDADFVLCPVCRVVSPLNLESEVWNRGVEDGGVGIGFTFEDLRKWQEDIVRQRRASTKIGYGY